MNPIESGTMFSAQARTGIPLIKTDVNRTIEILRRSSRAVWDQGREWGGVEVNQEGWGSGKPKNTDWGSSTLPSAEKLAYE